MYYRALCNELKFYGSWIRRACTVGNDNESWVSVKVMEIRDQNFGSCVVRKDAAPWSKGEDMPVHAHEGLWRSGGITPLIFNVGTSWDKSSVSFTSRSPIS